MDINLEIQVVDWDTNLEISWIQFIINNSTLQITPFSQDVSTQCVKLSSNHSCQHQIYSNRFFILIKNIQIPLVIVNSLEPLYVYSGQSKLFALPEDLLLSESLSTHSYSVSVLSWSINSKLYVSITKYNKDKTYYLYVLSNNAKTCEISISISDLNYQSVEVAVQIIALNWASKDWEEWTSQYQADWVKCNDNYRLGAYGVWYRKTNYFPNSLNSIFDT